MGELNVFDKNHFLLCILKFLKEEMNVGDLTEEKKESVEVAIQCLEIAYDISNIDEQVANIDLQSLFSSGRKEVTDQQKLEAENYKKQGNDLIAREQYIEAERCYTKAIELNPQNPVYFCNRAAVYSKLDKHLEAIQDCNEAIKLDPSYGKAYSRLGVAYSNLNLLEEARTAYETALKFDPTNVMYQNNLILAESRIEQSKTSGPSGDHGLPFDVPSVLAGIATQMFNDQSFRDTMSQFMQTNAVDDAGVQMLLQAGQTIASRINEDHPNLADNIRRAMENPAPQSGSKEQSKNPDDSTQ